MNRQRGVNFIRNGGADQTNKLLGTYIFIVEINIASRILAGTTGHLLVREEYRRMYDRLCAIGSCGGVVLTDQPGIGKSMSLIYFLIRRMTERKPTFLTTDKVVYVVSPFGIFKAQVDTLDEEDLPESGPAIWSLIDSNSGNHSPPSILSEIPLFPIFASSDPSDFRYKKWIIRCNALAWIMNPWTEDELKEGLYMRCPFSNASFMDREKFLIALQQAIQE